MSNFRESSRPKDKEGRRNEGSSLSGVKERERNKKAWIEEERLIFL